MANISSDAKGDCLFMAVDNYTGHGFVYYQRSKSAADCNRSKASAPKTAHSRGRPQTR